MQSIIVAPYRSQNLSILQPACETNWYPSFQLRLQAPSSCCLKTEATGNSLLPVFLSLVPPQPFCSHHQWSNLFTTYLGRLWPLLVKTFNCFLTTKDKVYKAQHDLVGQDYVEPTYFSRFLGPLLPVLKGDPLQPGLTSWSHSPSVLLPFLPSLLVSTFFVVLPISPSSWPHCLPVLPSSSPTSLLPLFLWSFFLALPSSIPTFSCVPIFLVLSVSLFSQPHLLAVPSSSISTFYCVSIFFVVLPSSPFSQHHLLLRKMNINQT